jgi:hypothetical protein
MGGARVASVPTEATSGLINGALPGPQPRAPMDPIATLVPEMRGSLRLMIVIVGEGMVDSEPAGIDCGADCEETYWDSTVVTLTATADGGSHLVSWSGDCEGSDPACAVRMYTGRTVTVTFELDRARVYLPMVRKE